MTKSEESLFEKLLHLLGQKLNKYRMPIIAALLSGFAAHGFSFANKLVQQDDLNAFFGKGASVTSGRWMLEALSTIMPDYSMPWIYGIISLLLLAAAACVVIKLLDIKSPVMQCLFAAIFAAFPTVTGIFTMPFTAAPYSLAILMAALGAYYLHENALLRNIAGVALIAVSTGIYQAYISFAASLLVAAMIKSLVLDGTDAKTVFKAGVRYLLLLAAALVAYGAVTLIVNLCCGAELASYAYADSSILLRIKSAYTSFAGYFIKGYFSFINSTASLVFHIVTAICALYALCMALRGKGTAEKLLTALLMLLLPLSINSLYLASSPDVLGATGFVSFTVLYAITAMLLDGAAAKLPGMTGRGARGLALLSFCVITAGNIYFANEVYLKLYMQTEEMTSFYTSVMTQIMAYDEYDGSQRIAFLGTPEEFAYQLEGPDTSNFKGLVSEDVYGIYSREDFVKLYLGYDVEFAPQEICEGLSEWEEIKAMPVYPANGSICRAADTIVVKFQ